MNEYRIWFEGSIQGHYIPGDLLVDVVMDFRKAIKAGNLHLAGRYARIMLWKKNNKLTRDAKRLMKNADLAFETPTGREPLGLRFKV